MKHVKYDCGNNDEVSIPVPESYQDCYILAQSDYYRYTGTNPSFWQMLSNKGRFRFNFWLRMTSYKGWAYPLCHAMFKRVSAKMSADIRPHTRIGYGFCIGHGSDFVVGEQAVVGNNVHIGPRVHISDYVTVGDNAAIWADSKVMDNVPHNVIVSGSPAQVVRHRMGKDM